MSAEFRLVFINHTWYQQNACDIANKILSLPTYIAKNNAYCLSGSPYWDNSKSRLFDVRLFLEDTQIVIEISAHPPRIEKDLAQLFTWIRSQTEIKILDDDGQISGW
ncbi:MAG: hypothetical protein J6577_04875 [Gilliamella sp.]|nr:hypothetical protein [Gilliamella sp.]